MFSRCLLVLPFLLSGYAFSQGVDSLKVVNPLDTISWSSPNLQGLDSSYASSLYKLDSIQQATNANLAGLKYEYDSMNNFFELQQRRLTRARDSLTNLNLPTASIEHKLDSIQSGKLSQLASLESRASEIKSKAVGEIDKLQLPSELEGKVKDLTTALDKVDISLPTTELNLPTIDLGGFSLGSVKLPDMSIPGIDGLPDTSIPDANLPDTSLPNIDNPIGDKMNEVTGQVKDIQSQVPTSVDDAAVKVENKVGEMSEVKELADNLPAAGDLPNEEETKKQLAEQVKNVAVNHFAGKEEQLKSAMDKMSKYKQKYSSVQSIKDLPDKPPNPLHGKPFVERLVPGLALQVLKRNEWLMDIAPYIGYRFTPRLSVGVGWNSRIAFESTETDSRVYGPRMFGEFKVFKGISGRLELETMNAFVPANLLPNSDVGRREWVPAVLAGMKKDYKIYKRLKGTAFMLYNFYNPNYKSPYGDRLNIRFGFEYVIKKRKKESDK